MKVEVLSKSVRWKQVRRERVWNEAARPSVESKRTDPFRAYCESLLVKAR